MVEVLNEFYGILDSVMLKCMNRRIVLFGYGYGGRFVQWYAQWAHGITVDYIISKNMTSGQLYESEIFRPSLFSFEYKDVGACTVWICDNIKQDEKQILVSMGYTEDDKLFDVYHMVYGDKNGYEIQPMQFLEFKYGCDFVSAIESKNFTVPCEHANSYRATTQKEVFSILDRCHCRPKTGDAFFDFGCGKGTALVAALDYGFEKVGGGEFQPDIFRTLHENRTKLRIPESCMNIHEGDVSVFTKLDEYNWFYFFQPFDSYILLEKCLKNIRNSLERSPRKATCIFINPINEKLFLENGFVLWNAFTVAMKQRVVKVYTNEI